MKRRSGKQRLSKYQLALRLIKQGWKFNYCTATWMRQENAIEQEATR